MDIGEEERVLTQIHLTQPRQRPNGACIQKFMQRHKNKPSFNSRERHVLGLAEVEWQVGKWRKSWLSSQVREQHQIHKYINQQVMQSGDSAGRVKEMHRAGHRDRKQIREEAESLGGK